MRHLSSYFRSNAVLSFREGARWFAGISFVLLTALLAGAAHADGSAERDALRPIEKALETLQVTNYQIRQNEESALLLLRRPSRSFGGPDADGLLIVVRPFKWEGQSQQWYQLEAPNLYSLRQCEHPNAARRVLLEAPYKTQTDVQFYCNPNAGSVSARVAMPASNGTVSSALLAEYLDQIVRSVDTIDPVVQRAMVSGLIDWPMDDEGPKEPKGFLSVPGPDGKLVKIGWAPWFEQSILASSAISSDPIWRKFTEQNDEERERMGHWLALEAIDGTNESTYQAWMTSSNYVEQHYPPFSIRFWGPPGTKVSASVRIDGFAAQTNGSDEIDAMGVKEVDLLPEWNVDALLELDAPKQVTVHYTVTCGDQSTTGTTTAEIQPVSVIDPALELVSVAQAVNEDHPWVRGLISEARALGITESLGATADTPYSEGIRQIYAVWKAFRNRGLSYVNIANHTGRGNGPSQTIRLLHDALREESANCADGSAALASVLRKLGFDVYLMYPPNHVLIAVYFDSDAEDAHWAFIETTAMGQVDASPAGTSAATQAVAKIPERSRGEDWDNFVTACEAGLRQAQDDPPRVSIDKLRTLGLRPIPSRASVVGPLPKPMPADQLIEIRNARREVARKERERLEKILKWLPEVAPVPYRTMEDVQFDIEALETSPEALRRLLAAVKGDSLGARGARAMAMLESRAAGLNRAWISRFKSMPGHGLEAFGITGHPWDIEVVNAKDEQLVRFNVIPRDKALREGWIDARKGSEGWFVTEESLNTFNEQSSGQLQTIFGIACIYLVGKGQPTALDPLIEEMRVEVESGKFGTFEESAAEFERRLTTFFESIPKSTWEQDEAPPAIPAQPMPPAQPERPTTRAPSGGAVTTMQVTDLLPGSGPAAKAGDKVTYHYVCSLLDGKVVFDSRSTGRTRTRTAGETAAPAGLGQGLVGARKGMHRRLRIPPNLAYGKDGLSKGNIPPDATVVIELFVDDVSSR
jgi:hypothetical protein